MNDDQFARDFKDRLTTREPRATAAQIAFAKSIGVRISRDSTMSEASAAIAEKKLSAKPKMATAAQISFSRTLGIQIAAEMTCDEASKMISAAQHAKRMAGAK